MLATRLVARTARVAAAAPRLSLPTARGLADARAPIDSTPPVAVYGLDGTYASALYTAAAKTQTLDAVARALESLSATLEREPRLPAILTAPTLSPADKQQVIVELQRSMTAGGTGASTLRTFLETLAENNRLGVLPGVCGKFATLMGAARGEVEVVITSAAPLESRTVRQLETAVGRSAYVGAGKKPKVVTKVDPDIRGGLVVEIGDRTIDLSVSSKMTRMNKMLQETL